MQKFKHVNYVAAGDATIPV